MNSYPLVAAALGLVVAAPASALAQNCAGPLELAAEAASNLPGGIPYQIPDQLQAYHDEALELVDTDPAACLVIVGRMNALIARYMLGGGGGVGTSVAAAGAVPARTNGRAPEERDVVTPATLRDNLSHDDAERLSRRIASASADEAEHLAAIGEYRDAARGYVRAMRSFAVAGRSNPAELSEIDAAVSEIDSLTRDLEKIVVVNAPEDVVHARLEDAVRRVEDARRALERAWKRYHARKAAEADDFLAPLVPSTFEPAPLDRDFLAPLGDADTRAAQLRLRSAERALKQVRNDWNPHVHRSDRPFLDMRDGYKQAYKDEYKTFADQLKAFDATLESYAPDRIALFTRRRVELWEQHERRLDAIFDRYAIP